MTEALADKVATFPAETPDFEVADALNATDDALPTKAVKVSVSAARGVLLKSGAWAGIVLAAENTGIPVELRAACITARDTMLHLSQIDTDEPATLATVSGMLDALVQAGLMQDATKAALLALAERPQSWADVNNGGVMVTSRDVGLARGGQ